MSFSLIYFFPVCSIANCLHCSEEGLTCQTCQDGYDVSSDRNSCTQVSAKLNPLVIVGKVQTLFADLYIQTFYLTVALLAVVVGAVFVVMISLFLYLCIFRKRRISEEKP